MAKRKREMKWELLKQIEREMDRDRQTEVTK
jgi:hypothetical protein